MQVKAQLSENLEESKNIENQWSGNVARPQILTNMNPKSPKSSLESIDYSSCSISDGMSMQDIQRYREGFTFSLQAYSKKNNDLTELQELALRMAGN